MKQKIAFFILAAVVVLVVLSGIGAIPSLKKRMVQINEEKQNWEEQLSQLRAFEATVSNLEMQPTQFTWITEIGDRFVEDVLIRDLLNSTLKKCALEGEVILKEKAQSEDFPSYVKVHEITGELGIKDYDDYGQLIDFFRSIRTLPIKIEALHVAGDEADMKVEGKIRFKFKVFLRPRS